MNTWDPNTPQKLVTAYKNWKLNFFPSIYIGFLLYYFLETRRLTFERFIVNYKHIESVRIRLASIYLDQFEQKRKTRLTLSDISIFGKLSRKKLYIAVCNLKNFRGERKVGRQSKMDDEGKGLLRE